MTAPDEIAILRIELEDIKPLIWRRVGVRTSMTLKAVHDVIQTIMGWLPFLGIEPLHRAARHSQSPLMTLYDRLANSR
jgi:hypothetical protein